jgi:hypothetical protein
VLRPNAAPVAIARPARVQRREPDYALEDAA